MVKAATAAVPTKPPASASKIALQEDLSNLPDFMRDDIGKGTEGIGMEDMDTPRIKLMQGLSPELESKSFLRIGHFYHTANDVSLGASFRAVAVYRDDRYILWKPRDMGGGILARADDGVHWQPANRTFEVTLDKKDGGAKVQWTTAETVGQSGLAEWGSQDPNNPDSQPAATLMYNFVLAFPDHPEYIPAVMSFQRTSIKAAKKLNAKLKTVRTPMFGLVLQFDSFKDKNAKGQEFQNIRTSAVGLVTDEALYKAYRDMNVGFSEAGLAIKDLESAQQDADELPADGGEPETPSKGKVNY